MQLHPHLPPYKRFVWVTGVGHGGKGRRSPSKIFLWATGVGHGGKGGCHVPPPRTTIETISMGDRRRSWGQTGVRLHPTLTP